LINILNKENVLGISIGALSMIVPVYQSEIWTREVHGRLVSLQQLAILLLELLLVIGLIMVKII
jgi:hypothetical protein